MSVNQVFFSSVLHYLRDFNIQQWQTDSVTERLGHDYFS